MKNKIIIFASTVLFLGLNSCSKQYFDINQSPNNATNASAALVLPNALTVTAAGQQTAFNFLSAWMGYLGQSGSYAVGQGDIASYKQTNTFGEGLWQNRYHNLEDYNYVEQSALTAKQYFYVAAAKIMKAFVFQQTVDMFNNIPYTQAFQGTNEITPKYDSAQSVYNAVTLQIDSAVVLLQRPDVLASSYTTYDVLFGKDPSNAARSVTAEVNLWIQFANTLELRILMRQSRVSANASFVQGEIAKIKANGAGFLTINASVNPGYANSGGQQSPIWGFYVTLTGLPTSGGSADFWKANQYSIGWLTNHNDPRIGFIYSLDSSGKGSTYLGSVLGAVSNPPGSNASSIGPGILKNVSQPAVLLSAAESYFLQAEADLKGWLSGTAQTDFNSGVQASFNFLGAGDASAYTSQGDDQTDYTAATLVGPAQQLACIIRQKWIAMDMVTPFEAWCDYRRLHLPADISLSISPFLDQSPASIPIRILYPTSEYQTNTTNVNAQGTIDYHTSAIFWNQ